MIAIAFCFWQDETLLDIANDPLPANAPVPITFSPTEPFFTTVRLSVYGGILLTLPLLLYQVYAFVLPAFAPHERKLVLPFLLSVPVLFIGGAVFAYFVVMPAALDFLLGFNVDEFDIEIRASEYYGFFMLTLIAVGILFQIPVAVLAVCRLGIVTPEQLGRNRALRRAGDCDRRNAPSGHGPRDDADLDAAALPPVRVLAAARARIRPASG